MRYRDQGFVDLLEIYHARKLRDQVIRQLKRLGSDAPPDDPAEEAARRAVSRHYEVLLLAIAELLDDLGDREPLG